MKTLLLPQTSPPIGEFTYEGCRYAGISPGQTFSVLSDKLAEFLIEIYPFIEETELAPVATNEYCCSKCNKDCGSKYMKERHEKSCKAEPQNLTTILKPTYIFWNYKNLDRTQLTPDQLIPETVSGMPQPPSNHIQIDEKDVTEPMPGTPGIELIGKRMEKVSIDRDGISWYGDGLTDDIVNG